MKKYKTLLFDADNTLLDFDKTEKEALRKTFTMQNSLYPSDEKPLSAD